MSECYKCGAELPEGQVECAGGCDGAQTFYEVDGDDGERYFRENFMEINWDLVKTLEDVIAVMRAAGEPAFVSKRASCFERVKKFLKPIKE